MSGVTATNRLVQGARLLMPAGRPSPTLAVRPRIARDDDNGCRDDGGGGGVMNGRAAAVNSLGSQLSVLRLSSTSASSSFCTSAVFHCPSSSDMNFPSYGAKSNRLKQPHVSGRPVEEMPDKPKKPFTGYIEFCQVNRPMVKRAQPLLTPPEIIKVLAEMWKRLDPSEKEKYLGRANRRREQYGMAMEKWNAQTTESERARLELNKREVKMVKQKDENLTKQKMQKRSLMKELDKPKKPLTTFFRFIKEQRELKAASGDPAKFAQKEFLRECAVKYKNLPESEMLRLKKKFDNDKKSYQVAIEDWNRKMTGDGKVTNVGW